MVKLVNLNRARKQRAREQKRDETADNALKHGLSNSEKQLMAARNARTNQLLDQHKHEDDHDE
ncbi:MAG: DUF4169 family protein [Halocynthiibacter sp.]